MNVMGDEDEDAGGLWQLGAEIIIHGNEVGHHDNE